MGGINVILVRCVRDFICAGHGWVDSRCFIIRYMDLLKVSAQISGQHSRSTASYMFHDGF